MAAVTPMNRKAYSLDLRQLKNRKYQISSRRQTRAVFLYPSDRPTLDFSRLICYNTTKHHNRREDHTMKQAYDVAAYIWPAYTGDEPRARIFWEEGYGEWQSVHNAPALSSANGTGKPKDYVWNRRPLWGYVNEADPTVMEMEIACAHRHGVNVFIYDWYWYDDRPFLEQCLDNGYLQAKNNDLVKFYLMWANHNATNMWNIRLSDTRESDIIWRGDVSFDIFRKLVRRWIEQYFSHPSYYKIDGRPVFMIYDVFTLIKGLGGSDGTRAALDYFRDEVKNAGFPGLHLQIAYNAFMGFDYDGRCGGPAGAESP